MFAIDEREENSRKVVAFLRQNQPWLQSALKCSLTACISLTRGLASPGPTHKARLYAKRLLCPAFGTHLHPPPPWHLSQNLSRVTEVFPGLLSLLGQAPGISIPTKICPLLWGWRSFARGSGRSRGMRGVSLWQWGAPSLA